MRAENPTTVGFVGSGQIGSAIARLAIEAGHQVVLNGEAAAAGQIIVVTLPVSAFPDVPSVSLAGKTVIDTCNYGPSETDTSLSLTARRSPRASCCGSTSRTP